MEIEQLYQVYLQHPVVTTDSRNCPPGSLFFALKGTSFNGNLYAEKALEAGCTAAVVDDPAVIPANDARFILVNDVLSTLQALAAFHRQHFHGPVIQITGTNGKTTTKELTAAVLNEKFRVLFTQGNLNNHIGVPLTLLRLRPEEHQMAIIETGANHPGEIAFLSKIVDADFGLITNVGHAHIEGFGSFEGVKQAKGELYDYLLKKKGTIFIDADNPHLQEMLQQRSASAPQSVFYGTNSVGTPFVQGRLVNCNPFLEIAWKHAGEAETAVRSQLIGAYNISNLLAAICVGTHFGISATAINHAIANYKPGLGRSEYQQKGDNELIIDAYNANLTSMTAALENFGHIQHASKIAVLGDMKELGTESDQAHSQILELLLRLSLQEIWLVGDNFKKAVTTASLSASQLDRIHCFEHVDAIKDYLKAHRPQASCLLIKGSNSTRLYELPACF